MTLNGILKLASLAAMATTMILGLVTFEFTPFVNWKFASVVAALLVVVAFSAFLLFPQRASELNLRLLEGTWSALGQSELFGQLTIDFERLKRKDTSWKRLMILAFFVAQWFAVVRIIADGSTLVEFLGIPTRRSKSDD